ncbi:uncharacterized protein TEOVI_000533100 [Trypanosoma equiperdum]|uniref:Uncharacterized protein n=1 Tax=Trypanosoma equiperdum TaxID=5694 RepID=A0A1G4I0L6_TRYEQ|nr:hypothetical protein TEOVI_000533100 [Trypanosoma equiperdum]
MAACMSTFTGDIDAPSLENGPNKVVTGKAPDGNTKTSRTDRKCIITGTGAEKDMFDVGSSHSSGPLRLTGEEIEINATNAKLKARSEDSD